MNQYPHPQERTASLPSPATLLSIGLSLLPVGLAFVAGCDPEDDFGVEPVDGFGTDAGMSDGAMSDGAMSDGAMSDDGVRAEPLAFGVISSDRTESSISLLGPDGEPTAVDFIHSGSAPAGLVTALSGDITLPTQSGDPSVLTILDRFQTDVLTRVDPKQGEVLGQMKTHTPPDDDTEVAYSSNPQDYVFISESEAWLSRFEPNGDDSADDIDRGSDLLRVDPTDMERERSLSLDKLNGEAEIENPDTGETKMVTIFARPGSIVRVGDEGEWLVVGLSMLSAAFDAAGKGMVALVDLDRAPSSDAVTGFELEGLQNCGNLSPVPGERNQVVVSCSGFFRGNPRDSAGVALLSFEDGELAVEYIWRGTTDEDAPLTVASVVSLGGTEVVAVAYGKSAETDADGDETAPATNDTAYLLNLDSGEHTELFEGVGRYVLGTGAFNSGRGLLLMPDGSVDDKGRPSGGVRRFLRRDDGGFEADGVIELDDTLPPRQVRAL